MRDGQHRGVVFADIDGTLIGPRSALLLDADVGATDVDGRAIAWASTEQRALFHWLQGVGDVVPVTGRGVGAYGRVQLPFAPHAVVHHGAVILGSGGSVCRDATRPLLEESAAVLLDAVGALSAMLKGHEGLKMTTQTTDGLIVEVCLKHRRTDVDVGSGAGRSLPDIADKIERVWRAMPHVRVHRNGNNLAMLPRRATKARAVQWLRERFYSDVRIAFGAGDSATDYGFMASCDVALVPIGSQLDGLVRAATRDTDGEGDQRG